MFSYVFKFNVLLILVLGLTSVNAKTYTMVVEPIFPRLQSHDVYEPLKNWLVMKTGHDIKIIADLNYSLYWKNSQGSRMPDFTLDASHIASYRQAIKGYEPLVTTNEQVTFHLISKDVPQQGQSTHDYLIGKRVMTMPRPSYASELFDSWFTDLFASPTKNVTAFSWQDGVEAIFDQTVDSAIVPNWVLDLYPNFTSLISSKPFPGLTFMASPNVPDQVSRDIKEALLELQYDELNYDVLVELNTSGFKTIDSEIFDGLYEVLADRLKGRTILSDKFVAQ